jgi:hypothetical protein
MRAAARQTVTHPSVAFDAVTYEDRPAKVMELLRTRCPTVMALVLVRIDENGNEFGPPVVRYAPPSGPGLN